MRWGRLKQRFYMTEFRGPWQHLACLTHQYVTLLLILLHFWWIEWIFGQYTSCSNNVVLFYQCGNCVCLTPLKIYLILTTFQPLSQSSSLILKALYSKFKNFFSPPPFVVFLTRTLQCFLLASSVRNLFTSSHSGESVLLIIILPDFVCRVIWESMHLDRLELSWGIIPVLPLLRRDG